MARPPNLEKLFEGDPHLRNYEHDILLRYDKYHAFVSQINQHEGGLSGFADSYKRFGLIQEENGDIVCHEWVPDVKSVSLVGDFNDWSAEAHTLEQKPFGKWYLRLAAVEGRPAISHGTNVKLAITTHSGELLWRLSPWIHYATQAEKGADFIGTFWSPKQQYTWENPHPPTPPSLLIYEAHVGISSDEPKVASYLHFADNVLPRIKTLGYNCVQLMAIMEHPYYGSFGYHVSSFFAVSSRYGNPDELKYLIDKAHGMGLLVFLDVIHSHAAGNVNDGINLFNGTDHCFFHGGAKGKQELWDSKLFDYSKWEVVRFLLSNLKWYVDEYRFDGFRFDGITSMLYHHHGIGTGFSGDYNEYFNMSVDVDALVYLMMANKMLHDAFPFMVTIAEDVSGMPSLCCSVDMGGVGFDHRLGMAIPDMWIKMLKEQSDENWSMGGIWWTLTNRRETEGTVAYAESHDQALVGDKTLAFWLMDAEMYTNMSTLTARTIIIDRALALHKMIRLITFGLGGEAYLNFMGNEFGHPEWLDFPRHGNNNSYHYARRQWRLVDDELLRYRFLNAFDQAMIGLERCYHFMSSGRGYVSRKHDGDKFIAFERGGLVWVFNFHPTQSYTGYRVGVEKPGSYKLILNTDAKEFDGHDRVDPSVLCHSQEFGFDGHPHSIQVYVPSRVALVLVREESVVQQPPSSLSTAQEVRSDKDRQLQQTTVNKPAKDTPSQGKPPMGTSSQVEPMDTPSQVEPPEDTPSQVEPPEDTPSQVEPPTDTPSHVDPPKNTPSQVEPPTDTPSHVDPPKDTPSQVDPPKDTPSQVEPPKDAPSRVKPPTDTPSHVDPPKDTPSQVEPPTDTPSHVDPPKDTPSQADHSLLNGDLLQLKNTPADQELNRGVSNGKTNSRCSLC